MPEILYSSIFGALTQHVQARFDAASKLHKQLFDNVIFERFLDWDTPTIGLDFEEIIGQYNITVAAPTIGDQSKEAILGTEGLETVKERILNHAVTLPMTIQDYRKVLQILDSKSLPDKAKTEQLIKLMWGSSTTVVSSVLAKLDILFLRPLSNEGIVELDDNINPEGGVRGTINLTSPPRISRRPKPRGRMPISTRWTASRTCRASSTPHRTKPYSAKSSALRRASPTCAAARRSSR